MVLKAAHFGAARSGHDSLVEGLTPPQGPCPAHWDDCESGVDHSARGKLFTMQMSNTENTGQDRAKAKILSPTWGQLKLVKRILKIGHTNIQALPRLELDPTQRIARAQLHRIGISKMTIASPRVNHETQAAILFEDKEHFHLLNTVITDGICNKMARVQLTKERGVHTRLTQQRIGKRFRVTGGFESLGRDNIRQNLVLRKAINNIGPVGVLLAEVPKVRNGDRGVGGVRDRNVTWGLANRTATGRVTIIADR